ncbi:MAG TPA: NAD(P)/FAD-dependent oxidoreductase [Methyloceanibacter sp.]|nr:NAD(P)/FAD-dependent oxidoreductase [Methyloceanibacter sp.]
MFKIEAVVVGAGVIGLSIARALAARGLEVLVLEREAGIGQGISSRNSEVIHAGLYYAPGSLKARLCVEGRRALYQYCAERGVPHRRCGKLVVATTPNEDAALTRIHERADANGVEETELIGAARLKALEPHVQGTSALLSGTTGIVDGHALMLAFQGDAEAEGATVQLRAPLAEGAFGNTSITLRTGGPDPAEIETGLLVNAAGIEAWDVSSRLQGLDPKTIPPRHLAKGSYFSLSGGAPFSHLIYPVPMAGGLGIHLTFDLGGETRFGPDVEWVDRIDYGVDPSRAEAFYAAIRRYWPALPDGALLPAYAGIRPRTTGAGETPGDFVIQGPAATGHKAYIALYGIDSPGLTASLAIGDYVAGIALQT